MKFRTILTGIIMLACSCSVFGAASEEVYIKNIGFARTISFAAGILKTTKIEANGVQVLDLPSVEFMIEIENKGETATLIPSDFDIKNIQSTNGDRENALNIKLDSKRMDYPLSIEIVYKADIKSEYQQKYISISPNKKLKGMILRRISIDDLNFKPEYLPVTPADKPELLSDKADSTVSASGYVFDKRSNFAAFDPKNSKGFYFYVDAAKPVCVYTPGHYLSMCEEMNVPLEKGYDTSSAIIGAIAGSPDTLFAKYRIHTLNTQFAALGRAKQFAAFKKNFDPYFSAYRNISSDQNIAGVSQEVHIINNKGLLILVNSSNESHKVMLPLDSMGLTSTDAIKLSDISSLESPVDLGVHQSGDKVEIELTPNIPRIIGINLEAQK